MSKKKYTREELDNMTEDEITDPRAVILYRKLNEIIALLGMIIENES